MEAVLSKNALINWANDITKKMTETRLNNLQDLSNGVHFCLLLSIMTQGNFKMGKINQQAKLEHEKLQNLKELIVGMGKNKIDQHFDIAKISRKNYQEILHMLQWFHKVIERTNTGVPRTSKSKSAEKIFFKVKAQADMKMPIKPKELKKEEPTELNPVTLGNLIKHRANNLLPLPSHRQNEEPIKERAHSPLTDVTRQLWRKASLHTTPKIGQNVTKDLQKQSITHEKSAHSLVKNNQLSNEKQEAIDIKKPYSQDLNLVKEEARQPNFTNPEEKAASDRKFVSFHKSEILEKSIMDMNSEVSKEDRPVNQQKSCLKSTAQKVKQSQEKKIQSVYSMNYEGPNSERSAQQTPK